MKIGQMSDYAGQKIKQVKKVKESATLKDNEHLYECLTCGRMNVLSMCDVLDEDSHRCYYKVKWERRSMSSGPRWVWRLLKFPKCLSCNSNEVKRIETKS